MEDANQSKKENNQKPATISPAEACKTIVEKPKNDVDAFYIDTYLKALNSCTRII